MKRYYPLEFEDGTNKITSENNDYLKTKVPYLLVEIDHSKFFKGYGLHVGVIVKETTTNLKRKETYSSWTYSPTDSYMKKMFFCERKSKSNLQKAINMVFEKNKIIDINLLDMKEKVMKDTLFITEKPVIFKSWDKFYEEDETPSDAPENI